MPCWKSEAHPEEMDKGGGGPGGGAQQAGVGEASKGHEGRVENLISLLKDLQSVNIQLCLNICTVVSVSKQ